MKNAGVTALAVVILYALQTSLLPLIAFGCEPAADGWASHNAAKISVLGEACATIPAGDKTLILESRSGQVNCAQSDFR